MKTIEFTLEDFEGTEHRYGVELFSVDVNANMQLEFVGPISEALGNLVQALAPAFEGKKLEEVMGGGVPEILKALAKVDFVTAPRAVSLLSAAIKDAGGSKFVAQLFSQTKRYYHEESIASAPMLTDDKPKQPHLDLGDANARDLAFGDGNYGEYWQAVLLVLLVNFTRFGRSESANLKTALGTLTGGLLSPSKTGTATASDDLNSVKTTH